MTLEQLIKLRIEELEKEMKNPFISDHGYTAALIALTLNKKILTRYYKVIEFSKKLMNMPRD